MSCKKPPIGLLHLADREALPRLATGEEIADVFSRAPAGIFFEPPSAEGLYSSPASEFIAFCESLKEDFPLERDEAKGIVPELDRHLRSMGELGYYPFGRIVTRRLRSARHEHAIVGVLALAVARPGFPSDGTPVW